MIISQLHHSSNTALLWPILILMSKVNRKNTHQKNKTAIVFIDKGNKRVEGRLPMSEHEYVNQFTSYL